MQGLSARGKKSIGGAVAGHGRSKAHVRLEPIRQWKSHRRTTPFTTTTTNDIMNVIFGPKKELINS